MDSTGTPPPRAELSASQAASWLISRRSQPAWRHRAVRPSLATPVEWGQRRCSPCFRKFNGSPCGLYLRSETSFAVSHGHWLSGHAIMFVARKAVLVCLDRSMRPTSEHHSLHKGNNDTKHNFKYCTCIIRINLLLMVRGNWVHEDHDISGPPAHVFNAARRFPGTEASDPSVFRRHENTYVVRFGHQRS